jgi:hypothetical protein
MNSRVGRVAIKLRMSDAERDRADELRRTVEQVLLQQALDELERIVHERLGSDAIVRARTLSLRWQLDADLLGDNASALEMGRDLAASLLGTLSALPREERLRPAPHRDVVVFADEDHAIAAYLADGSDGRSPWFHAPRNDARAEWDTVVRHGTARIQAVRTWLDRMDYGDRVMRWLGSSEPVVPASAPALERGPDGRVHDEVLERLLPSVHALRASTVSHAGEPPIERAVIAPAVPVVSSEGLHTVATDLAGIWYLARLVSELELAELLWQIGVREGDFLAHVVATIAGVERDPACSWFGGVFDREPELDPIAAWAHQEIDSKLSATLERLGLEPPAQLRSALRCSVAGTDPRTADIVVRCAAAIAALFCTRLDGDVDLERLRCQLRVPGRMELADPLRVLMPMERIDIDLRRAGLDLDPGYLPWLQRKVVLSFEEAT